MVATLFSNIETFTSRKSAELAARNESLLFLNQIRKAFSTDIVAVDDPARRLTTTKTRVKGDTSANNNSNSGVVKLASTISTLSGNTAVDLFSYRNMCAPLPKRLHGKVPQFNTDLKDKIFSKIKIAYDSSSIQNCVDYLEDFQCPVNMTPYVEFENRSRVLHLPKDISPSGKWTSSKSSAIAGFMCETEKFANDLRPIRDITIVTGYFNHNQMNHSDLSKRLIWDKYRMVIPSSSPSDNVFYLQR